MYVSRNKLQNGSCHMMGNRCKNDRVMVELEADVYIKSRGTSNGLRVEIPEGGQQPPSSGVGA